MKEVFSFFMGVLVGGLIAILITPQSGVELRKTIKSTTEQDWEKLQAQWKVEIEKIQKRLEELQIQTNQTVQKTEAELSNPAEAV